MMQRLEQRNFKVAIIDEPDQFFEPPNIQYNFDQLSASSKHLLKVLSKPKRTIVLSCVHVTNKPVLFYTIAKILRPDLMPPFMEYAYRYCDPR